MKVPERWKWLFQPLSPAMRGRLEVCLGVVLTGAAVVALSTVIHVDPAKLAAKGGGMEMPQSPERSAETELRALPPPAPKVAPEFAHAVARGDLDTMNRLYIPNMPLDGMLALAAESGEKPVAIWLLDRGADVKEDEGSVDAPVLLADQHPEMVDLLLARGAAQPSLTTAAEANALNAVVRLLAAHADVNPPDNTPLTAAVASTRGLEETRPIIVEKLLVAGADPNRDYGETAVNAAVRACDGSRDEHVATSYCVTMIKLLGKHGARTKGDALLTVLGIGDESVRDALFEALMAAPLERGATATALAGPAGVPTPIVKRLAAKGIDWAWHDGEDDAALPLHAAVARGDRDYVRELLDVGAPVNVHFKDTTSPLGAALEGASGGGSPSYDRIIELLIARGVDVNRRLPDGRTPLFAAAEGGSLRAVLALLDHGARVNDLVLDDTALDAAEQSNSQAVARVLSARGGRRARKNSEGHVER
jgi:ankyrin repeat protein